MGWPWEGGVEILLVALTGHLARIRLQVFWIVSSEMPNYCESSELHIMRQYAAILLALVYLNRNINIFKLSKLPLRNTKDTWLNFNNYFEFSICMKISH